MFGAGVAWIAAVLAVFEPNLLAHSTVGHHRLCFHLFLFGGSLRPLARGGAAHPPSPGRVWRDVADWRLPPSIPPSSLFPPWRCWPPWRSLAGLKSAGAGWTDAHGESSGAGNSHLERQADRHLWACPAGPVGLLCVSLSQLVPTACRFGRALPRLHRALEGTPRTLVDNRAARFKLLPESYLFGLIDVLWVTAGPRLSFLLGHLYPHAIWYYFPVAFVIKSTLGFLALLILGAGRGQTLVRRMPPQGGLPPDSARVFHGRRLDRGHQHGHPACPADLPFSDPGRRRGSLGAGPSASGLGHRRGGAGGIPPCLLPPYASRLPRLLQ